MKGGLALHAGIARAPKIRRVLAAIDPREVSRQAWKQAKELADSLGAVLHAVYIQPGLSRNSEARVSWFKADRRFHVLRGNPASAILRLASDFRPDILVMGRHRRQGVQRVLLGSVSEEVASKSQVPVLTVHEDARPIRSILVPVATTHYGITGLFWALILAEALNASVSLLHVSSSSEDGADPDALLKNLLRRLPQDSRKRCHTVVADQEGDPASFIAAAAEEHDLTVLTYHKKRPLLDVIFGTTMQRVLRRSRGHILCVPFLEPASPLRRKLIERALRPPSERLVL